MYEFTHGGTWFNWKALDRSSRWLAIGSIASALIAVGPLLKWTSDLGYRIGLSFGMRAAGTTATMPATAVDSTSPWVAFWVVGFGLLSAILWWRLSVRQDELFHRIQNYALGMGGAWTAVALTIWGLFDMVGLAASIQPPMPLMLFTMLTTVFGCVAARQWAS